MRRAAVRGGAGAGGEGEAAEAACGGGFGAGVGDGGGRARFLGSFGRWAAWRAGRMAHRRWPGDEGSSWERSRGDGGWLEEQKLVDQPTMLIANLLCFLPSLNGG